MSFHTPPPGSYANYLEEKRNRTNQNSNYAREIKSLLSFFFRMWLFEREKKLFLQFQSKRMKSLSSTGRVLLFWIQQVEIDLRKTIFWWICDMENHKLLTVIKRKCHTQPMSFRIRKENYSFSTSKSDSNLMQYFHNLSCYKELDEVMGKISLFFEFSKRAKWSVLP